MTAAGCVVLAGFLFVHIPVSFAADVMVGVLKEVRGNVEILKRGETEWRKARSGAEVMPGDKLSTGMQGTARLEYRNSAIDIEPLTQFVVGRTLEDSEKFYTEMFLQVGKIISEVNPRSGKQNKFTVTTPAGVCGIRGSKQEVGHFPQTGTEMRMLEGHGFMGAVKPENLPAPVQAVLGIAPAAGGGEAPAENAGLLSEQAFDFVYTAGAGQSIEVRDMIDPGAVVDAAQGLARDAVADVTPAALSDKEREATQITAEPVDAPVAVTTRAELAAQADEVRTATTTAVTTSTTIRFPDRPGQ
ncbi:MAG: hypothetical protein A3G34_09410 [Candidatus Lindowbacteria bacterium RIFCSPLOWO2_12_FULL_62_27]|nr:MAG: hypothetical protein A3I06_08075 [Candidatus Lindowbacteria bacterium RIFCSPLOWO2_02_FULL_62_12]OGH60254.1 MAG: hypothetical protein A3G34_09410 [Candidatus Lindowbacteria bacterium RIFCSPLOWO2_12_FULL_62_27]